MEGKHSSGKTGGLTEPPYHRSRQYFQNWFQGEQGKAKRSVRRWRADSGFGLSQESSLYRLSQNTCAFGTSWRMWCSPIDRTGQCGVGPQMASTRQSPLTTCFIHAIKFRGHALIWKTWVSLKVKIFLWLTFKRRHRTRHGLEARKFCYLCDQYTETIDHIVATCPYAREVWSLIHQALGRQIPQAARRQS